MPQIILPDTSLCAIVRDEMMNPAGGIFDFVESTMPFVEYGVIVDTGSVDGTRETLEQLSGKYPNLKIFDRKFDGYATSRNFSLGKVGTKMALVLDADERLTSGDFKKLATLIDVGISGYNFDLTIVQPDMTVNGGGCHNPRLFVISPEVKYVGETTNEILYIGDRIFNNTRAFSRITDRCKSTGIAIKHFLPSQKAQLMKVAFWYESLNERSLKNGKTLNPSQLPCFQEWKAYNPMRDRYR